MGFLKIKQPLLESGRAIAPIQSLTAASTGTLVTNYGVTVISSSGKTFRLAAPARQGEVKEVILRPTAAGGKISLRPASTASVFYNSTKGTLQTTTAQNAQPAASVRLYAVTSTQWAVLSKTTGVTFQA